MWLGIGGELDEWGSCGALLHERLPVDGEIRALQGVVLQGLGQPTAQDRDALAQGATVVAALLAQCSALLVVGQLVACLLYTSDAADEAYDV